MFDIEQTSNYYFSFIYIWHYLFRLRKLQTYASYIVYSYYRREFADLLYGSVRNPMSIRSFVCLRIYVLFSRLIISNIGPLAFCCRYCYYCTFPFPLFATHQRQACRYMTDYCVLRCLNFTIARNDSFCIEIEFAEFNPIISQLIRNLILIGAAYPNQRNLIQRITKFNSFGTIYFF